jgi:hypothetical protein
VITALRLILTEALLIVWLRSKQREMFVLVAACLLPAWPLQLHEYPMTNTFMEAKKVRELSFLGVLGLGCSHDA